MLVNGKLCCYRICARVRVSSSWRGGDRAPRGGAAAANGGRGERRPLLLTAAARCCLRRGHVFLARRIAVRCLATPKHRAHHAVRVATIT